MSRYLVRRWLVGIAGLSLTLLTAGLQAQTQTESDKEEAAKEQITRLKDELAAKDNQLEQLKAIVQNAKAEKEVAVQSTDEQEAKRRKEMDTKDKQIGQMREAIVSMQEQLKPIREKKQYEEDLEQLASKARFARHRLSPPEARIHAELSKPTVLEFIETPLPDVVSYLKDYHKMEIQIDQKALDDAGIGSDTPISRDIRGISLRSALTILLREFDMTWLVDNQVLLLTTNEAARNHLETRTYDVQSLLTGQPHGAHELAEVVRQLLVMQRHEARSGHGMGGGPATVVTAYRNSLIVRTNPHGHREVEDLLEQLAQGSQSAGKKTAEITIPDVDVDVQKRP